MVLASLNQARVKGRDAAIKSEMSQLVILYQEQYSDTASYAPLWTSGDPTTSWFSTVANCTSPTAPPTGSYAAQEEAICAALMSNESNCLDGASYCLYLNIPESPKNTSNYFSVVAYLPGAQQYYCMGSSGIASYDSGGDGWIQPGCWGNP